MEHLQPDYETVSTFYAYYETVSGSDGVTDPSNAPEGIKLGGRAKPLYPDRTVGDILWHNNGQNLMLNFRFRATAVPAKWWAWVMILCSYWNGKNEVLGIIPETMFLEKEKSYRLFKKIRIKKY